MRRRLHRLAWSLVVLLLGAFLVKAFWLDVFHVDTGSMEPTISGSSAAGDFVAVVYDDSPPERWEIVVVLREGTATPVVKRVVGLPGEKIQLQHGDLFVEERHPADARRPSLVPIFDDRVNELEEAFTIGNPRMDPWTRRAADTWSLDSRAVMEDADAGMMFLHGGLHDGHLDREGRIVRGKEQVNDGALECGFRFSEPEGRLRLLLNEWGDTFQVKLEPGEAGYAALTLTSRHRADTEEVLARTNVPLDVGDWHAIHFANVDDVLSVELDGVQVLSYAYDGNHFHPLDHAREGKSPAARAALGGEGALIDFRRIRVLRDLWWQPRGEHAVGSALILGPDEIFVLGDRSAASRDSRSWGPVRLEEIVGRPAWIVWPPARWRSLRAAGR